MNLFRLLLALAGLHSAVALQLPWTSRSPSMKAAQKVIQLMQQVPNPMQLRPSQPVSPSLGAGFGLAGDISSSELSEYVEQAEESFRAAALKALKGDRLREGLVFDDSF